jgi:hypothetical protein
MLSCRIQWLHVEAYTPFPSLYKLAFFISTSICYKLCGLKWYEDEVCMPNIGEDMIICSWEDKEVMFPKINVRFSFINDKYIILY